MDHSAGRSSITDVLIKEFLTARKETAKEVIRRVFNYKVKLSAFMPVINVVAAGLSYIATQGNITGTIICTAISIGITQGISYHNK